MITECLRISSLIRSHLIAEPISIVRSLQAIRPTEKGDRKWLCRMAGFVDALKATGFLKDEAHQIISEELNRVVTYLPTTANITIQYSFDIYTRNSEGEQSKYQIDVDALNSNDAYAKLASKTSYASLNCIETVYLFLGPKAERVEGQKPTRVFGKSQLITPLHNY